jgi:hypothetical protein
VLALPERLRAVVIGYFFQERPMLEIAGELGVTESRVSQLRAEALILLRDGLNAHLDPDTLPAEPRPEGRLAKRRAAYHAAIATCSDFRARLDAAPRPLLERAAETGSATPFRPESPFRQRIRLIRSGLHNISEYSPKPPRLAPFQTVCSVRTMARTVGG